MIIDVDIQEVKQEQEYSASPTSHRSTQSTLVYPTYDPRYNVSSSINYAPKDPRTPLLGYSTPVLLDHPRTRIQSRTMRALVATLLVGALTCGLLYKFTQNGSWKSRTGRPSDDTIIVTTTPHSTSTSTTSHPSPTSTPREPNDDHSGTPLPKPSGSCLPSRLWRHHSGVASTTIRFPVDADVLRFDSVGPLTKGIVYFSTLPLGSPNFVGYEIIAYHPDPNILEKTQLCVQQGQNDGVYGATLYSNITDELSANATPGIFDIKVYMPGPEVYIPGRPRHYKRLEMDLPFFRHEIQLSSAIIKFESVDIRTNGARVTVPDLAADDILIKTSNEPINGYFDVYSSIHLETTQNSIMSEVQMFGRSGVTSVVMKTTEARIWSQIECYQRLLHLGEFNVTSSTTGESSSTHVRALPFGSTLMVDAGTTGDQVHVQLPLTFEGAFDLTSGTKGPTLLYDPLASDPSSQGKRRTVTLSSSGPRVHGNTMWKSLLKLPIPRPPVRSFVKMHTTLSGGAILKL